MVGTAGRRAGLAGRAPPSCASPRWPARPPERALRELLALQSSDWAFLHTRATAGDYPIQRARGHLAALERALAGDAGLIAQPTLRGLAPDLTGWG